MSDHSDQVLDPIAQDIWDMKYRFKAADGAPVDDSIDESWWRVAKAVAAGRNAKQSASAGPRHSTAFCRASAICRRDAFFRAPGPGAR